MDLRFPCLIENLSTLRAWYGFSPVCILMCTSSFHFDQNSFHTEGMNMVSLQCEFSCVLQAFHFDQNSFHTEGMNMVTLQCEFSCVLQAFRFDQNSFHTEGMNIVSLQCESHVYFKLFVLIKTLPHWGHVYGFSPVWTFMSLLRYLLEWNLLQRWLVVVERFSPAWILMWPSSFSFWSKLFPHWGHE